MSSPAVDSPSNTYVEDDSMPPMENDYDDNMMSSEEEEPLTPEPTPKPVKRRRKKKKKRKRLRRGGNTTQIDDDEAALMRENIGLEGSDSDAGGDMKRSRKDDVDAGDADDDGRARGDRAERSDLRRDSLPGDGGAAACRVAARNSLPLPARRTRPRTCIGAWE